MDILTELCFSLPDGMEVEGQGGKVLPYPFTVSLSLSGGSCRGESWGVKWDWASRPPPSVDDCEQAGQQAKFECHTPPPSL